MNQHILPIKNKIFCGDVHQACPLENSFQKRELVFWRETTKREIKKAPNEKTWESFILDFSVTMNILLMKLCQSHFYTLLWVCLSYCEHHSSNEARIRHWDFLGKSGGKNNNIRKKSRHNSRNFQAAKNALIHCVYVVNFYVLLLDNHDGYLIVTATQNCVLVEPNAM